MLAYEGAIFVPIAVPLICKKILSIKCKVQYECEQLDKTFRWWFFNVSLVPDLSTYFDTVSVWDASV